MPLCAARPPLQPADTAADEAREKLQALVRPGRWAEAILYAADGRPLLRAGGDGPPVASLQEAVAAAAREGEFRLHDARALAAGAAAPRMDFLAPVDAATVLVLSADPRKSLYAMVQSWPLPSRSSEALLVRAEEDAVVSFTLPHVREPLTDTGSVAVRAILHGAGIHEGRDYRGAEVVAACETVPGTAWHVVAKTDLEEVLQPLERQGRQMLALVLLAIGLAGAFVAYLWRNRQAALAERERRALAERDAMARKLETLFEQARDAILLIDPDGRIVEANAAACALYGYGAEDFRRLHIRDLRAPGTLEALPDQFAAARPEGVCFETVHRRADGSAIPVEVSSRGILLDGKLYSQSFIRDISARRQAEETIRRQLDELRRWYEVTLEREERIGELKAEVNELRRRLGEPPRYGAAPPDMGGTPGS